MGTQGSDAFSRVAASLSDGMPDEVRPVSGPGSDSIDSRRRGGATRPRPMKTAIATVSISGTLDEKLAAIAAAGFTGVEILEQDLVADDRSPREIGQAARDAGLEVTLYQPFRDFEGLTGAARAKAFDRAERKFDLMQDLGCELLLVVSSVHPEALGGIDRAAADLADLGERAARRGLRVGYEALAWGRFINDHRDAWEAVRRADHPAIGIILDSFHTLGRRIDPDTIRDIPGDRIFLVQVADAPAIEMDVLYWSRHFRNMPGEGDLDVTRFLRAAMATGYCGPVSLEIFNDQYRGAPPETIARDGYRALVALMDDVRRAEPKLAVDAPAIPGRVAARGLDVVEFHASGADAPGLAAMLDSLGFERLPSVATDGRQLWQQGEIRIAATPRPAAPAIASATVARLGFRVASAADAVTRAMALGAKPVSGPAGNDAGGRDAVCDPAGGIVHFLDDTAPQAGPATPAGGCGLVRIDHVAQTVPFEEMLAWSLFYTSLFDISAGPIIDLVDPGGLVRSRALGSPDGGVRLVLNGAETPRTLAGRFLAEGGGATVQHLAFATDDILATADRLAARGFESLPMPRNYYDDLAARFDIPADRLARMQAANILYDRVGDGEFFQLYSRPFGPGVVFEIVERRGGYGGYGAANASCRIAAQKRLAP